MSTFHIIVANEPKLLRDMLKRVLNKPADLQIVGEAKDWAGLSSALNTLEVQWVIVSLQTDGNLPEALQPLLLAHPQVGFLALAKDGSRLHMKSAALPSHQLDNPTLPDLLALLRHQYVSQPLENCS